MRAVVAAHVDYLAGLLYGLESRLDHCLRAADEGHHRAVCGLARVYIEQLYALRRLDYVSDLLYNNLVATLAEVGHALYNLPCLCHSIKSDKCQLI